MYTGERGYLDLLYHIMRSGTDRKDRTGIGTRSIFSANLEFDLNDGFPLLTTKKVFWKGVIGELLWFLSGNTDLNSLRTFTYGVDNNQKTIWDIDYQRWHNENNQNVPTNEGGNLYGRQWRHFTSGNAQPVDQIKNLLSLAEADPTSRRLIINAWNAADIHSKNMALPPCHFCIQVYIENNQVNLKWSQRSCDMFLGVPFNIASYAALAHIFANWLGLGVGKLVGDLTNVHIYNTHFDAVEQQLNRLPKPLCTAPEIPKNFTLDTVNNFTAADFAIYDYECYPAIKAPMAG